MLLFRSPTVLNSFPEGLFYGCSAMLEIPFRAGIKELPESVFEGCSSIKSLVIPETVTKISSRAAAGCTDLVTVVLPASLYELADDAFEGCTSIRNIRISEDNKLFYVSEDDGCLYERTANGIDMRLFRWYAPFTSPVGLTGTTIISGKEHYG